MSLPTRGPDIRPLAVRTIPAPLVLVVDDDRRVRELLEVAFTAHRFRVTTAADGDEAIQKTLAERPDLVICDSRLPRKSGLEVCDFLRHDPEQPNIPFVLISAAADTEARLDAFTRGADDFLQKPFSPKELIARARRHIARAAEARQERQRAADSSRELGQAREALRRSQDDTARERRMRELAFGIGRDLHRCLDLDVLAERILVAARQPLGAGASALLVPVDADAPLTLLASRGDRHRRYSRLSVPSEGAIACVLAGLGRPATLHELERIPELRPELPPLVAAGISCIAPLRGRDRIEGLILAEERADGRGLDTVELEALSGLCELASESLRAARAFRAQLESALALAVAHGVGEGTPREATLEASRRLAPAIAAASLPPRERGLLAHAIAFGPWGWSGDGLATLTALASGDATGYVSTLQTLVRDGETLDEDDARRTPEWRRAALLAGIGARYAVGRGSGRSRDESWRTAVDWAGSTLDPATRRALEGTEEQPLEPTGSAT